MGWPGLWQEVRSICEEIGLPDVNEVDIPVNDIKEAISNHHYKFIKEELAAERKGTKKLKDIKDDDFRNVQEYFSDKSVANGRMAFRIRSQMVEGIPSNFKNKYQNQEGGLLCEFCQKQEEFSQSHCLVCPAWESQRMGLELTKIDDLVTFFRKMLVEKERIEQEVNVGPPGVRGAAKHDSCLDTGH